MPNCFQKWFFFLTLPNILEECLDFNSSHTLGVVRLYIYSSIQMLSPWSFSLGSQLRLNFYLFTCLLTVLSGKYLCPTSHCYISLLDFLKNYLLICRCPFIFCMLIVCWSYVMFIQSVPSLNFAHLFSCIKFLTLV